MQMLSERDLTEGGIREIGLVEAPWLVKSNREEKTYPMATMDLMASLLDLLQMRSFHNRPLDGHSLVPYLQGKETDRPVIAGLGWYGTFKFGSTDHVNGTFPFYCPNSSAALVRGISMVSLRIIANCLLEALWWLRIDLRHSGAWRLARQLHHTGPPAAVGMGRGQPV